MFTSIENANCASFFIEQTPFWSTIKKKLEKIKTNIFICDIEMFMNLKKIIKIDKEERVVLFNCECVIVRIADVEMVAKTIAYSTDINKSSQILFTAFTSGSCGECKTIGVTYKCFLPNVNSLS